MPKACHGLGGDSADVLATRAKTMDFGLGQLLYTAFTEMYLPCRWSWQARDQSGSMEAPCDIGAENDLCVNTSLSKVSLDDKCRPRHDSR